MTDFSARFRSSDWRKAQVPPIAAGNYAIWQGTRLLYCGMSGRQFDPTSRLVVPTLTPAHLSRFDSGELTLDMLTKDYIHAHLEFQFACVPTAEEAHALEARCLSGEVFGIKPDFNSGSTARRPARVRPR